jgi:hypothetical protein
LPQLETPKPKTKMKTFNWNKLPVNKILGKRNIWSLVAKKNEDEAAAKKAKKAINFTDMEHLFCQQPAPSQQQQQQQQQQSKDDKDGGKEAKKKEEVRSKQAHIYYIFSSSKQDSFFIALNIHVRDGHGGGMHGWME